MSESRVAMILRRFKEGGESVEWIASTEGVSRASVEDVIRAYLLGVDAGKKEGE